jgi:hypothetical protein
MISPTDLHQPSPAPHFKPSMYVWSTSLNVQCQHNKSYTPNAWPHYFRPYSLNPTCCKRHIFLVECWFCTEILNSFSRIILHLCCQFTQILETFHSLQFSLICHNMYLVKLITLDISKFVSFP